MRCRPERTAPWAPWALWALIAMPALLVAVLAVAGCTSATTPGGASSGASTSHPRTSSAQAAPTQRVRSVIDRFNATANGPVADQQRLLAELVDPGQAQAQRTCPTATRTLRLEPVYAALAPATGWTPPSGTMGPSVYSLPSLIRVYQGGRLVGTDLTDVHLSVTEDGAHLAALCVS